MVTPTAAPSMAPHAVVIAGPNGAGKSTMAPQLLRGKLGVQEFVNADVIAQQLSPRHPEAAAIEAGRVMLTHMERLAREQVTFAFETTLAGRTVAHHIARLRGIGYDVHLAFLWLPSAEMAIERVRSRVATGGHNVPEPVIRRRYSAGLRNLYPVYIPLMASWRVYNSGVDAQPPVVAVGAGSVVQEMHDAAIWRRIIGATI
jgi:predicted ABC-type ATPase